jgi:hypothetical protein
MANEIEVSKPEDHETDIELQAIQSVVKALERLDQLARERVISYVFARLGLSEASIRGRAQSQDTPNDQVVDTVTSASAATRAISTNVTDIRTLKQQKKPRNSVEMAALVAYYLLHLTDESERQDSIGTGEIEKYFVQADFPIPVKPGNTLAHAKNAGYLEVADRGRYRLNAVGHNLVVHSLPVDQGNSSRSPKKRRNPSKRRR